MNTLKIDRAVQIATQRLAFRPAALITDIDGTLSPIVRVPEDAVVLPRARDALRLLADRLELVAAISGRTVAEARRMVGLDDLLYVGNHGIERWDSVEGYRNEAAAFAGEMSELRDRLAEAVARLDGVRVEDKEVVVSLHYRTSLDPQAARAAILDTLKHLSLAGRFVVTEGKMVVEVRPPVSLDKGASIASLIDEFRLKSAVFLGDDRTDVDAMVELKRSSHGGLATFCIGIGGTETPDGLIDESDLLLADPHEASVFLERLATVLPPP